MMAYFIYVLLPFLKGYSDTSELHGTFKGEKDIVDYITCACILYSNEV